MFKRVKNLWDLSTYQVTGNNANGDIKMKRDPEIVNKKPAIIVEDNPLDIFQ